jgi:hypothetical protein
MKQILSKELFDKGKSRNGSWSRKQFEALGVPYPLESGWYRRLIGREFDVDALDRFLNLKDAHLKGDATPRDLNDRWASGYNTPQCYAAQAPVPKEIIEECPFDFTPGYIEMMWRRYSDDLADDINFITAGL